MKNNEILVADGSSIDAAFMRVTLERNGWKAEVITDGNEVLSRVRQKQYRYIIINGKLKRLEGAEVIARIRDLERESNQEPATIIGTVGSSLKTERQNLINSGANECLSKPVYQDRILALLEQAANYQRHTTAA